MADDKEEIKTKKSGKVGQIVLGVFMTVAVGSFLFSDVAQYLGQTTDNSSVKVGRKNITKSEIAQEEEKLKERFKGLPPEFIAMQNLSQKAKETLIEKYLLSEYGHKVGFRAPKADLANIIDGFAFFKDETGKFSQTKYRDFLKRTNMTEDYFLELLSDDIVRDMIVQKMLLEIPVSPAIASLMQNHEFEKRKISYSVLKPADITNIEPLGTDEAILKKYYEEHKNEFSRPETRQISYVAFTAGTLEKALAPSEKAIKKYYEKNKEFYSTPEKRKLLQLTFETKEKADEAYAKLEKGADFIASALDLGFELENIELGLLTKNDVPNEIANDIFTGKEGEFTHPLKNDFGYAIYFSEKIEPATLKSLAETSEDIKGVLLKRAFIDFKDKKFDIIDDDIAGGATIAELSKKYNIPLLTYDDLTASGQDYKTQAYIIKNPEMLRTFFDTNDTENIISLDLDNDGFIFGKVDKINPVRPLTFDEAKPLLPARDHEAKLAIALNERFEKAKLLQKEKGATVVSISEKLKSEAPQEKTLSRNIQDVDLPPEMMEKLFNAKKGELVISDYNKGQAEDIVVASVTDILQEEVKPADKDGITSSLSDTLRFEIYKKMISELRKEFKVTQ